MTALGIGLAMPFVAARGAGASYSAEAEALFARFTTPPTTERKGLINDLIVALKDGGVWSKLDGFYVMAAADNQAARRNWIADQYNLTAVSAPTFTTDRGYQGDGAASYLDTGFNPTTAVSPKFTQNASSLGVWSLTAAQSGVVDAGSTDTILLCRNTSDAFLARATTSGANLSNTALTGAGMFQVTRVGASDQRSRLPSGSVVSNTSASTAPANAALRFCGRAGTVQYSVRQQAIGYVGAVSEADMSTIAAACAAYLSAVGATA